MWFITEDILLRSRLLGGRKKVVFYTSKHGTFWHINSGTPLIHKLYIISSRSSGLLMSPCHIKKSILSIDGEFMAEIRAAEQNKGSQKSLMQTEREFFDWANNTKKAILNNFWANDGNALAPTVFNHFLVFDHSGTGEVVRSSEVNRVIIHVESVTSTDSFSLSLFVAVCIHRTSYQMSEKLFFCYTVESKFRFYRRRGDGEFLGEGKGTFRTLSWQIFDLLVCSPRKDSYPILDAALLTWLMALSESLNYSCFLAPRFSLTIVFLMPATSEKKLFYTSDDASGGEIGDTFAFTQSVAPLRRRCRVENWGGEGEIK